VHQCGACWESTADEVVQAARLPVLLVNPDECIDCGASEPECPENAIFQSDAVPSEWSVYVDLNRRWFEDKAAVRVRIDELKPRVAA
jgi:NAD-dependent dihydropyrimidine dehydrogenase PreA subunit